MFCIGMICMKWLKTFQSIIRQCSNSIPTHLYLIHVIKKDPIEKVLAGNSFVNLIHFKQKVDDIPASWWNTYQLRFFPTFINIIRNRNCLVEEYSSGLELLHVWDVWLMVNMRYLTHQCQIVSFTNKHTGIIINTSQTSTLDLKDNMKNVQRN